MNDEHFMHAGMRAQQDIRRAMQDSEARVDTKTASKILGVGVRTLESWRAQGNGPPYLPIGKRIKYELAALYAFLDQQRVEHPNQ